MSEHNAVNSVPGAPLQPAPYQHQPSTPVPGKSLGIVGFILSLLGPLTLVGLIVSIIAKVQSRKAGAKNGFALAGIIIGAIGVVVGIIVIIAIVAGAASVAKQCADLGPGVHQSGSVTITCGG
ncbi:hypothetical protein ABH924_001286 [Arthrobacter sp. GAS37]|uniref:DUF4190 domain-containing protein n=1 Tax=Arthrobacter sp. GAS37 TaxID=3156261 RepID=UPI00383906F9